ncbi:YebC/PmpR family DNA-binding transcriptional regulator [candidate division WOR-3 bacterium]|nr:YebC/PmpR family DNA-binding transcriptional regulator [candidate division WOR-3 bacterium]
MSGHSKWSTIKHKKGKEDAKRGKLFTKAIREITMAAREGGGDIDGNPRLRHAVDSAKAVNMPADNIDRAIKKGTGELEGVTYEEIKYEGYGPGGAAVLVETATDNKNRTTSEIRHIFSKYNGNLGAVGSVSWIFKRKGIITIDKDKFDFEKVMDIAIDNGAEDVVLENEHIIITSNSNDMIKIRNVFEEKNIEMIESLVTKIPKSVVKMDESKASTLFKLLEKLEENEDVQEVYSNFEVPDDIMEKLAK